MDGQITFFATWNFSVFLPMESRDLFLFIIFHELLHHHSFFLFFFKNQNLFRTLVREFLFAGNLSASTKRKCHDLKTQDKAVAENRFCFYQTPFFLLKKIFLIIL